MGEFPFGFSGPLNQGEKGTPRETHTHTNVFFHRADPRAAHPVAPDPAASSVGTGT